MPNQLGFMTQQCLVSEQAELLIQLAAPANLVVLSPYNTISTPRPGWRRQHRAIYTERWRRRVRLQRQSRSQVKPLGQAVQRTSDCHRPRACQPVARIG